MKTFQKVGGIAALIGASTNLLAIVMFITMASKATAPMTQSKQWLSLRATRF